MGITGSRGSKRYHDSNYLPNNVDADLLVCHLVATATWWRSTIGYYSGDAVCWDIDAACFGSAVYVGEGVGRRGRAGDGLLLRSIIVNDELNDIDTGQL